MASHSSTHLLLLLASLSLATSLASHSIASPSCSSSSSHQHPSTLTYYVQALNGANCGQTSVFAYNITQEEDPNSQMLGSIRGLQVYNSLRSSSVAILLLNTITYDDGAYNGTISLHGQATIADKSYELTIVGGTGGFRGVRGYAAITNLQTPGSDHMFEHILYFDSVFGRFEVDCPCSSSTV